MKTYQFIVLLFAVFFVSSCDVNEDTKTIKYRISDNASGFDVSYRDENGNIIKENVMVSSAEEIWSYTYTASEGEIVYVSANYKDVSTGINVEILMDGKVFKQGSSLYDTLNFVTVSGTVPYE